MRAGSWIVGRSSRGCPFHKWQGLSSQEPPPPILSMKWGLSPDSILPKEWRDLKGPPDVPHSRRLTTTFPVLVLSNPGRLITIA